ncbi:hypothetical protein OF83DRAFT_519752 [Amylostereum chailletii]|nr:hypothetical protein OF83DRAFT_519752 [Amylostereum chailletii]
MALPLSTEITLSLATDEASVNNWDALDLPLTSHFARALEAGLSYNTVSLNVPNKTLWYPVDSCSFVFLATHSQVQEKRAQASILFPLLSDFKVECSVSNSEAVDTWSAEARPLVQTLFALPMVHAGLRTLRVSYAFVFGEPESWHDVFGTVTAVTALDVHESCATAFLAASIDPTRSILFPHLQHLYINGGEDIIPRFEHTVIGFVASLKTWAGMRREAGSILRRITLANCEISRSIGCEPTSRSGGWLGRNRME